jgi:hypothetical protein
MSAMGLGGRTSPPALPILDQLLHVTCGSAAIRQSAAGEELTMHDHRCTASSSRGKHPSMGRPAVAASSKRQVYTQNIAHCLRDAPRPLLPNAVQDRLVPGVVPLTCNSSC